MSAAGDVVIDTCTLENFVVVDALGLLGERLGTRARWTETIRIEVTRGIRAEAEVLCFLEEREPGWAFLSDDRAAVAFARSRGLRAMDTAEILAEYHAACEIGCPDAYQLLLKMAAAGHGVRVPASHRDVC
jgi:hypothetical protein